MRPLDEIRASAKDFLSKESRENIQARLSKILELEPNTALILVFCGTFSAGKSSLINELLQQKFKLPFGAEPVTKFVTRLKYGKKFSACYLWHGAEYPLNLLDLNEILTGKLHLPDESVEVIIRLPAKILRGNVEILDTPGFLDNQELTDLTREAVVTADVALFCFNANAAGKKFELDYFHELEETIGNFCVIVNHMDALNTSEDVERVKTYIENNVAGRGRAILHFLNMEKLFFTIAGGKCVDLGMLKKFFSFLCSGMSKKFRRRLQRYSYQKRTVYGLQTLSDEVQTQIHCGEYFYSCADKEADSEYQKARKIYLGKCKKISELLDKILADGQKFLSAALIDIENKFDSIAANEPVFNFRDKATTYLHKKLCEVLIILLRQLEEVFPTQEFNEQNFFADYLHAVKNYSVPKPIGKRVNTDSGVKQQITTIIGTIFGNSKKENYTTVYEDFATVAKVHLRDNLLDRLRTAMNNSFDLLKTALDPQPPVKDESLLKEIIACQNKWRSLNTEIAQYLTFCREKFIWDFNNDRKFFPHAVR